MIVSILMLTHNAPSYVLIALKSLRKTETDQENKYEIIVVDNASQIPTKTLLWFLKRIKWIDKLHYNKNNMLFAKGNNQASELACRDGGYYLLLNSDVEILDPTWLKKLLKAHPKTGGISSYGAVINEPQRADGYCLLIDKSLYDFYQLDEDFEWWWSITKLQADVLKAGKRVRAFRNHEQELIHFGGKSGKDYTGAKGMSLTNAQAAEWFITHRVEIYEDINTILSEN